MGATESLVKSINGIRQLASNQYQQIIPEISVDSSIDIISAPLFNYPALMNEFINVMVQKLAYSQLEVKLFNNPLKLLEGDTIPNGAIGEEIYINPAEGRTYDINDFAGLLKKYEVDVKVQYQVINLDEQFPATIIRQELKKAFTSWNGLEDFINNVTTSLYNGAYIREYNATKGLVSNAYRDNAVQIKVVNGVNTKQLAESFVEEARTLFLNFQSPSSDYNAWKKVGGYGRSIISWSNPDDIYFLIRNDVQSKIDVQVLAKSFNIEESKLMGRIIPVDNFDVYDKQHNKVFDGSNILGIMCDKSWFRIKTQDMYMEDFRNANNRSITYYLNLIKMYRYSFFANAVVFATEEPKVAISGLDFKAPEGITLDKIGDVEGLEITVTPSNANSPEIVYTIKSGNEDTIKIEKIDERNIKVTANKKGTDTIVATAGNVSTEVVVNVLTTV